ncbi:LOW QUALITY PROTEIN: Fc receptor-like protein 5 [Xyrichtys novacula]|uniref:LOW QUALITY PROTEIN: Fc receptor-like protein 5 n=1 Tax=Xyrichtys novacula TaxID=13765 RepID=A0AAV1HLW9_XYRNO|nr:LOW QUALITY PROTEIN: Fc receptor-like protein 5 [Xyrichtys novacula]
MDVKEGHPFLCVLFLFLADRLVKYGHAEVSYKAVVTLEFNWTQIFRGESTTLRCAIQGGEGSEWQYEWMTPTSNTSSRSNEYKIEKAADSDRGDYFCRGRRKGRNNSTTDWSEAVTLTVYPKARAKISTDKKDIPAGGNAILTCSVNPPTSGWKFFWFRGQKSPKPINLQDAIVLSSHQISVSNEGPYWCKAERGRPVYSTENTDFISLNKLVTNKAVATIRPKWPKIYKEEHINFTCEIEGEKNSDWNYEWRGPDAFRPPRIPEVLVIAYSYHSGDYSCVGRKKNEPTTMTAWSDNVHLRIFDYIPKPALTVSPSWLSPGGSVTLDCKVEDVSAGWRFFWYRVVPKPSKNSNRYEYELLPGSSSGTTHNLYTVHGQTHTAGYACRARRGYPMYYTRYSDPGFVWSGDVQSASLSVSPDRVQHFNIDSVTLSCRGNSTEWRVKAFSNKNYWPNNSDCETMDGATCNIARVRGDNTVYWCESASGEFSNAVNITADKKSMILVSPVHPVTEGDSFTLGCKMETGTFDSVVLFYHNDKIIGNDTRGELKISAASKSSEGWYKCESGKMQSPQSWVSITPVFVTTTLASSSLVLGLAGLISGIVITVLLLLFCYHEKTKGSHRLVHRLFL